MRLCCCVAGLMMAVAAGVKFVPGQWPWERCKLQAELSPAGCGLQAAAGFMLAALLLLLFISAPAHLPHIHPPPAGLVRAKAQSHVIFDVRLGL